jgi:hypothetical protein
MGKIGCTRITGTHRRVSFRDRAAGEECAAKTAAAVDKPFVVVSLAVEYRGGLPPTYKVRRLPVSS